MRNFKDDGGVAAPRGLSPAPQKGCSPGLMWAAPPRGARLHAPHKSRFPGMTLASQTRDASFDGCTRDRVQGNLVNVDAAFFFLPIFWSILAQPSIFTSSLFLTQDWRLVYSSPTPHFIPVLLVYIAVTYISLPRGCGPPPRRGNGVLVYI